MAACASQPKPTTPFARQSSSRLSRRMCPSGPIRSRWLRTSRCASSRTSCDEMRNNDMVESQLGADARLLADATRGRDHDRRRHALGRGPGRRSARREPPRDLLPRVSQAASGRLARASREIGAVLENGHPRRRRRGTLCPRPFASFPGAPRPPLTDSRITPASFASLMTCFHVAPSTSPSTVNRSAKTIQPTRSASSTRRASRAHGTEPGEAV